MDEVMTMADVTANAQAATIATTPSSLPSNLPLFSAFLSFALAQFLKIFTTWYKEKRWDSKRLLDSGGMPSSHSATVSALAVAIGLQEGAGSPAFAVAVVLACIVMYDASGVRLHAGRQAENILCPVSDLCVIHLVILHFRCALLFAVLKVVPVRLCYDRCPLFTLLFGDQQLSSIFIDK
ncbi:membrane protein YuiD [Spatholobus suberectus]|nr:membrane protein YuiD [Spatholobus suberectus]